MICPHCGFAAPDDAPNCPSCGYLLRPPDTPPARKSHLFSIVLVALVAVGGFFMAVRAFRSSNETSISFFGKRAHIDFGQRVFRLQPRAIESVSIRNPPRTPVCRLYIAASTSAPDVSLIVLDSANLDRLKTDGPYTAVYETALKGSVEFTAQTEGGDVSHHVAVRYAGAADSAVVTLDRLRVQCFEKW